MEHGESDHSARALVCMRTHTEQTQHKVKIYISVQLPIQRTRGCFWEEQQMHLAYPSQHPHHYSQDFRSVPECHLPKLCPIILKLCLFSHTPRKHQEGFHLREKHHITHEIWILVLVFVWLRTDEYTCLFEMCVANPAVVHSSVFMEILLWTYLFPEPSWRCRTSTLTRSSCSACITLRK